MVSCINSDSHWWTTITWIAYRGRKCQELWDTSRRNIDRPAGQNSYQNGECCERLTGKANLFNSAVDRQDKCFPFPRPRLVLSHPRDARACSGSKYCLPPCVVVRPISRADRCRPILVFPSVRFWLIRTRNEPDKMSFVHCFLDFVSKDRRLLQGESMQIKYRIFWILNFFVSFF